MEPSMDAFIDGQWSGSSVPSQKQIRNAPHYTMSEWFEIHREMPDGDIFQSGILEEFDRRMRGSADDQLLALSYAPQLRQIIRELELRLKDAISHSFNLCPRIPRFARHGHYQG